MSGEAVGLDLGLSKDKSVAAKVRRVGDLVVVEALVTWAPGPGAKVDLRDVEEGAATIARDAPIILDPWQGVLMAQRLRARGTEVIEYPFTSDSRRKLFGALLDLIRTGRLRCRPHEELRRELLGLEVQETAAGWRVDHRVGRHDDHVVAVALAAQHVASRPRCDWPGCTTPGCSGMHVWSSGQYPTARREEPAPPPPWWEAVVEPQWSSPAPDPAEPVVVGVAVEDNITAAVALAGVDGRGELLLVREGRWHDAAPLAETLAGWSQEFSVQAVAVAAGQVVALPAGLRTIRLDALGAHGRLNRRLEEATIVLFAGDQRAGRAWRTALALAVAAAPAALGAEVVT